MTDRLYLRISLDTATSGSITKQRAALRARTGADAVEYVDESVSGSKITLAERPAGRRLLADVQPGDRVLATKIDRVARNVEDLLGIVRLLNDRGATITFTDQPDVSTEGSTGRLFLTLLAAFAQFEADMIGERRRESLAQFKEEGRHAVGRAPFGLRSVQNPNGRGLVLRPDPEGALVLRDVIERLLSGESQRVLAPLVGMGEPAFSRLLRNERLAGVLNHTPDGPRLDPEQAVFSLAEWRALQDYVTRPAKAWTKAEGIGAALACGVCGDRLYLNKATAGRNPAYATYRCRKVKHEPGQPGATVIRVNADAHVEDDFLSRFGGLAVVEEVTLDSDSAKVEAVAVARMRLDAARRAQDEAETDEEDETADALVRDARRALRTAESLSSTVVVEERETGETFAQVWADADYAERTALLLKVGPWVVSPGRMPLTEKVRLDEARQDYAPTLRDLA